MQANITSIGFELYTGQRGCSAISWAWVKYWLTNPSPDLSLGSYVNLVVEFLDFKLGLSN